MVFDNVSVGDKFRNLSNGLPRWIRVTELTERGFKYECEPYNVYPARYGPSLCSGGELFIDAASGALWDILYRKETYDEQWDWVEGTWKGTR